MPKNIRTEKGKMEINGHQMSWEIIRSEKPSVFGIHESRVYELNLYRDDTLTADYNRKWIKVPSTDDEESALCIQHILESFGKENKKKRRNKEDV